MIRKADIIITVGKRLAETIRSIDEGPGKKIHVITNGYDDDDFRDLSGGKPDKFTITYVGTLSEAYPMDKFISALQIIKNKGFDFILRFVGSVNDKIRKDIENRLDFKDFEFIPYSTHKEAVNYMKSSSALLLIIPALGNNRAIITGKLFEYIASQRPVLLIGPTDGDAAQILRKCGHKGIFTGDNAEEIEKFMMNLMGSAESVKLTGHPEFSRKVLTQKLSGILTNL